MNRPFLVLGADSLLGRGLVRFWLNKGSRAFGTTRRTRAPGEGLLHLDLTQPDGPLPGSFEAAVLCAGITSQEACRRDPASTAEVNVHHTIRLLERLIETDCFVVFLSSNLVFHGAEAQVPLNHPPSPATEYGRQKAAVEARLAAFESHAAVVRLTKVLHPAMALLGDWRTQLKAGQPVKPFHDYVCSPVPLDLVTLGLARIAEERRGGLWQFSAPDSISYAEMAGLLAMQLGADPNLVQSQPAPASFEHLPRHADLDAGRAAKELGLVFPPSRNVVERTLSEI